MNESIEAMARQRLTGRARGANRIYRVPDLPSALANTGLPSIPKQIRFRKPGIVVAAYGEVRSADDSDAAGMEARIQVAGTRDIITDGDAGEFMPFFAMFGRTQNWFPLDIPAIEGQDWTITYRYFGGTNDTAFPVLMFAVLEQG